MDSALDINIIFSQQGIAHLLSESKDIILAMVIGGTILGAVAGVIAYYAAFFALRRKRQVQVSKATLQPSPVVSD
jgi:uncharacterized protein (DUF2062 family)